MTLTQLAQKHNLEPESAKAFLREWLGMQQVVAYTSTGSIRNAKKFDDGLLNIWKDFDEMFREQAEVVKREKGFETEQVALIARPTDLGE